MEIHLYILKELLKYYFITKHPLSLSKTIDGDTLRYYIYSRLKQ
jgi:hypothetical protein